MDNNFNNTPENNEQPSGQPVYTDPNADVETKTSEQTAESDNNQQYTYGQQYNYGQQYTSQNQYQNMNYQQQYQDNYNYNVGNNTGYTQNYNQMDTTPMSMGDWVLTILALMIPCAGIVLYFVWAFGKNGNVNRRNYCRAALIIYGVVFVLYIVLFMIFGVAALGSASMY